MSLRKGTSIFNRQFRQAFNANKYQNLTAGRKNISFEDVSRSFTEGCYISWLVQNSVKL